MSLRFQRSVRIAPGVRVNFSKSGLGLSVGPRGAKVGINSKGAYSSVGIPGTGISYRQQYSQSKKSQPRHSSQSSKSATATFGFSIDIDEAGNEHPHFTQDGRPVTDEALLARLMRTKEYKEARAKARQGAADSVMEQAQGMLDICSHCIAPVDWDQRVKELQATVPSEYVSKPYPFSPPSEELVQDTLEKEAQRIHWFPIGKGKRLQRYVNERLVDRFEKAMQEYLQAKLAHEKSEQERVAKLGSERQQIQASVQARLRKMVSPTQGELEQSLQELYADMELPLEFNVSFAVSPDCKTVSLDVDLPEIEDFPATSARILANGKLSVKERGKAQKNADYARSVTGLGFFLTTAACSVSPCISTVIVSGYTQRIDRASGNTVDCYVYSVAFDAQRLGQLDTTKIDPVQALATFEHRIDMNSQGAMGVVVPIEG